MRIRVETYDPITGGTKLVPIEIQVRDKAMDLWATIEHKLGSKPKLLPLNRQAFDAGLEIGRAAPETVVPTMYLNAVQFSMHLENGWGEDLTPGGAPLAVPVKLTLPRIEGVKLTPVLSNSPVRLF